MGNGSGGHLMELCVQEGEDQGELTHTAASVAVEASNRRGGGCLIAALVPNGKFLCYPGDREKNKKMIPL